MDMTTPTLHEYAKQETNDLAKGLLTSMASVSSFFKLLPFDQIKGNALAYKRAQNPGSYHDEICGLETLVCDVEDLMDTSGEDAVRIAGKAKMLGRLLACMIAGQYLFQGLPQLCSNHQYVDVLNHDVFLQLCEMLDNHVDFIVGSCQPLELGDSKGIPILTNNYLSPKKIFAGRFDDGSRSKGLAGLIGDPLVTAVDLSNNALRLKTAAGLALYDANALACVELRTADGGPVLGPMVSAGCSCGSPTCDYPGSFSCRNFEYLS